MDEKNIRYAVYKETHFTSKDTNGLNVKKQKKIFYAKSEQKTV